MENVTIAEAGLEDLNDVAFMFDQYRQFYDQDEDLELAKEFLGSHMKNHTSIIFLASFDGRNCGFAQLYPTFCSVEASPILVLYDLFVREEYRRKGFAKLLMNATKQYASDNNFGSIELSTGKTNTQGQSLYESLGYIRDNEYYTYDLEI